MSEPDYTPEARAARAAQVDRIMERALEMKEALANLLKTAESLMEGEDCDHSVGICWCEAFRAVEQARSALAGAGAGEELEPPEMVEDDDGEGERSFRRFDEERGAEALAALEWAYDRYKKHGAFPDSYLRVMNSLRAAPAPAATERDTYDHEAAVRSPMCPRRGWFGVHAPECLDAPAGGEQREATDGPSQPWGAMLEYVEEQRAPQPEATGEPLLLDPERFHLLQDLKLIQADCTSPVEGMAAHGRLKAFIETAPAPASVARLASAAGCALAFLRSVNGDFPEGTYPARSVAELVPQLDAALRAFGSGEGADG